VVIMANSITELGGATRVAYVLASGLAARGYDVHLVGLETAETPHGYPRDPAVTRVTLLDRPVPSATDEPSRAAADLEIAEALAATLAGIGPGVIIATQVWCKEMLDRVDHDGWRVIGQYHSSAEAAARSGDDERLMRAYGDVEWFTLLTQADADAFIARGLRQSIAVPNPATFWPDHPSPGDRAVITFLGRLSVEKAPGILADAWAQIQAQHPQWRLQFVGSGPLAETVAERALPRTTVLPATDDPQRVLTDSSVLVVPSLVEGFPLSLLEGMACGLAVVSADASAGVRELIDDGVNGLLAIRGDAADLARQLGRVLADAELRRALGAAARATATLYRLDVVLDAWEQLLGGVTAR
jgi:glycosyltransferase involved in cell wall biosynthesis